MTVYLDDEFVGTHLTTADAFDCVERSFRLLADGSATNAPRRRSQSGTAILNVMWALAPTEGVMGVKSYPVVRTDVTQGAVLTLLLYSMETGELLSMMKADRLGQIRTGAATAVATVAMARPESEALTIFGTGYQAESQVRSLVGAMPHLRTVRVVGRSVAKRDAFIERMSAELDLEVVAGEPEAAASVADIIVTATGSSEPVLHGAWLRPGTHVNAVGSNVLTKREIDRDVLERASLILVDDREVARADCGDFAANDWDVDSAGTVGQLLTGRIPGRGSAEDITVFESQGLALQDVVCGALLMSRARERGLGLPII
ncbi:ornithine cyclodeaminase family protein [Cryobacterium tepidiphilum]|uniref:Ornithine cyclodeaminase family protein n=1 Tax=Cryobacterium tepidiphilum TaxID=2486026 RepID=A0A3M8LF78_9MICO|nr:ornithine cyclodeaminase family protein [Cryobacterium tepidiphilum]RNE63975.1 ornithine cyclodeaminase family protein [Cryobacterium tepidiphilum]